LCAEEGFLFELTDISKCGIVKSYLKYFIFFQLKIINFKPKQFNEKKELIMKKIALFFCILVCFTATTLVAGTPSKTDRLGIINGDYFGSTIEDGPQIMLWGNSHSSVRSASKDIIIDSTMNKWWFAQGERFDGAVLQKNSTTGSLRFVSVKNRSKQTAEQFLAKYKLIREVARSNINNRIVASVTKVVPKVNAPKIALSATDVLFVNTGVVMTYRDIQSLESMAKFWTEQSPKGEIVIITIKGHPAS
jgi:hypothetical protein